MAQFVLLMKLTDQGIRDIKSAPERIDAAVKTMEAMGGKLLGFWMTMGEYDYVAVGEMPDAATGAAFLLGLGAQGNVRTTTLTAFPREGIAGIVGKLP